MVKIDADSHKLIYHPERVSKWCEKGDCYPIYVEIGLTNRCNHRCIFCALDFLEHGGADIDREIILFALKDMAKNGVKSIMFAGEGESILHKDISEFVKKAKEYGMDVSITTNGVFFDRERIKECLPYLSWIRFSVDAGSPENYAKIHRTKQEDFNRVIENIKEAVRFRNKNKLKTVIGVQFLLISENVNEVLDFAKLIKGTGTDNIQIKPYSHHPLSKNDYSVDYSKLGYLEEELKKLEDENFQVNFRKKTMQRLQEGATYNECYGLPFFALIDARGNIVPCNLFYNNEEFTYGNLYKNSFSQIWESERRKDTIKKLKEKGILDCRIGCRLDPINKYLNRLKNPHPHDNFI